MESVTGTDGVSVNAQHVFRRTGDFTKSVHHQSCAEFVYSTTLHKLINTYYNIQCNIPKSEYRVQRIHQIWGLKGAKTKLINRLMHRLASKKTNKYQLILTSNHTL